MSDVDDDNQEEEEVHGEDPEFDDDNQEEEEVHGEDPEFDNDEYAQLIEIFDTSSEQARNGKDIQGIHWETEEMTKEEFRLSRIENYINYNYVVNSGKDAVKECIPTKKGGPYYEFQHNSRFINPTGQHFQFRNLVWATSKHDVYLMSNNAVFHYSALKFTNTEILDFSGTVAPVEVHPGSLLEGLTATEVSALAVKDKLLVAGGFEGELICKHLDRPGVSFCSSVMPDFNSIMTCIEIYNSPSGAVHFTASNNCGVKDVDVEHFQLSKHLPFPWAVTHSSLSPDGNLLVVVGCSKDGMLVDWKRGQTVETLRGHLDFSFATAWHPDGKIFATGNQDKTCRVWDVRNLSKSVAVLKCNLGTVQSIRFTSDGKFMAVAETADFVQIYYVNDGYEKRQDIDFFGEITGISFSPDTEALFIGNHDYGSLLQYRRCRNNFYLDSLI